MKRILAIFLILTLIVGVFPVQVFASGPMAPEYVSVSEEPGDAGDVTDGDEPADMTDAEALAAVYNEFSTSATYGTATKTPLIFPYEYNGQTYTNVVEFLKAWALKETGKVLTVDYTANKGSAYTYNEWLTGEQVTKELVSFDDDTNVYQDYFKNNADRTLLGLKNVTFKIGEETSAQINNIYIKISSLVRTPEQIVEYVTGNIPFARMANGNTSPDNIVKPLVDKGVTSGTLPTLTSTSELYSTTSISITWALENVSGKADALKLASNKITVSRPNVGEDNAVFTLSATVTSKTDASVTGTVGPFTLTVPAFDGVIVPVQVTKGAVLELVDSYYGTSVAVDVKYIAKQDDAPEGYDLYNCTLHTNAEGAAQSFKYTVSKEGYLTKTGTISVTGDGMDPVVIDLQPSTAADAKLASLGLTAPAAGSADLVTGIDFDPDVFEYNVEVKGVQSVKFAAEAATAGADVKITQRYSSLANANSGTLNTASAAITSLCYLPDAADTTSVIKITVTPPAGSAQSASVYTINVTKLQASGPMTGLTVTASSSAAGTKNTSIGFEGAAEEETLAFVSGGTDIGVYTVNYWRDRITVKPTAAGSAITVNGTEVASGSATAAIELEVGDNTIPIVVTKDGVETAYTLTVHRKAELYIASYGVEGVDPAEFESNGKTWSSTAAVTMPSGTDIAQVIVTANAEDAKVRIYSDGEYYDGNSGEPIAVPTNGAEKLMPTIWVYHTVNGVTEAQKFIYSIARGSTNFPDGLETYLPAPGQFVNTNDWGKNPEKTLTNNGGITLGAFGGSIVYRFDEPIANDPADPYGVDFIVFGNVFSNSDGSSAPGASEPASVMVSNDGETWYELAGSLYYEDTTLRNVTVTYTNSDTTFAGAVDIPWTDDRGNEGAVLANNYHKQAYYPDPAYYGQYQTGAGKNATYTAESVSFTGSRIEKGTQPVFGYADNHYSPSNGKNNTASNPYKNNHLIDCNGDGFDISWAVDANGMPVELESVKYVKIYNPNLADGGSTGEVSPEIQAILRAKRSDSDVGVSSGLTALAVNGEAVELVPGQNVYEISVGRAASFSITPTAAGSNIYVNNSRIESGASASNIKIGEGEEKLVRIVVQDGEKAPAIYILKISAEVIPQEEKDKAAAKAVEDMIAAIGEVTLESGEAIEAARAAFEALTDAQKAYVTNEDVLIAAEERLAELRNQDFGTVRVIVENSTFTPEVAKANGIEWAETFWSGTLVDSTIALTADTTMMSAVVAALDEKGYTQVGAENGYIEEVNGLAAFDGGSMSGWMGTLNDWFTNEGFDAFTVAKGTLSNGDEIRVLYSLDWGADIGSDYNSSDTSLADLKASVGLFDTVFDPETLSYTLTVPAGTEAVTITPTAKNKNFQVHLKVGDKEYKRSAAIPVADGTVIAVEVGTGPSMSSGTPTTYYIIIDIVERASVEEIYRNTGDYLVAKASDIELQVECEWTILGLARSGREIPGKDTYVENIKTYIEEKINDKEQLHRAKSSDNSRIILALTAIGEDANYISGHNLIRGLSDLSYVKNQGINGVTWALIALDSYGFEPFVNATATRDALIAELLSRQLDDNGWALTGTVADTDITAMTLQALAPYYSSNADVKTAVDKALERLSEMQTADGNFSTYDGNGNIIPTSESVSQVIVALTALGIDPAADKRFIKNGFSSLDALCGYYVEGGGFKHVADGKLNGMATDQGYYALAAYFRFKENKTSLYDMSDVEIDIYIRNGWIKEGDIWLYYKDNIAQTGWKQISGKWYYFNDDGSMVTGWKQISGKWYYFRDSGAMATGWAQVNEKWYYFNESGTMVTGWQTIDGKTYFFKSSGVMAENEWCQGWWLNKGGTWTYQYKASWKQDSKGWYYQDTSGWYARNATYIIDGTSYTFDASGYWVQ